MLDDISTTTMGPVPSGCWASTWRNSGNAIVVAVVDKGGILAQLPRALVGDLAELAPVLDAGIGDKVHVLGAQQAHRPPIGLEQPAARHDIVELQVRLDPLAQGIDDGGFSAASP